MAAGTVALLPSLLTCLSHRSTQPAAPVRDVPAWDDDGLGDDGALSQCTGRGLVSMASLVLCVVCMSAAPDLEMMEALEAQIAARQAQAAT